MILGDIRKHFVHQTREIIALLPSARAHNGANSQFDVHPLVYSIGDSLKRRISIHDPSWWRGAQPSPKRKLSIVVVGNGPVGNLGAVIDSADIVVRINQAKRNGFTELVGSKVDVRITSPETLLDTDPGTLGHIPHLVYNPYRINLNEILPPLMDRFPQHADLQQIDVLTLPESQYLGDLRRTIRCRKRFIPSTGAAAIQWALNIAGGVHQVSFTGFTTSEGLTQPLWAHYWDSPIYLRSLAEADAEKAEVARLRAANSSRFCEWLRRLATVSEDKHDMEREREWLRSLVASGSLRTLDDGKATLS